MKKLCDKIVAKPQLFIALMFATILCFPNNALVTSSPLTALTTCIDACKEAFTEAVVGYLLTEKTPIEGGQTIVCNCSFPSESAKSEKDCLENCRMYHMNGGCYFNKNISMCKASRIIEVRNNSIFDYD